MNKRSDIRATLIDFFVHQPLARRQTQIMNLPCRVRIKSNEDDIFRHQLFIVDARGSNPETFYDSQLPPYRHVSAFIDIYPHGIHAASS